MTYSNRPYRRGSIVWPVVLICLGGVFLLTNLGVISGDVWPRMLQLWPLLLVAIGIDLLLGRRSGIFAGLAVLLIFGMFAAGVAVVQTTGRAWDGLLRTLSVELTVGASWARFRAAFRSRSITRPQPSHSYTRWDKASSSLTCP